MTQRTHPAETLSHLLTAFSPERRNDLRPQWSPRVAPLTVLRSRAAHEHRSSSDSLCLLSTAFQCASAAGSIRKPSSPSSAALAFLNATQPCEVGAEGPLTTLIFTAVKTKRKHLRPTSLPRCLTPANLLPWLCRFTAGRFVIERRPIRSLLNHESPRG